MTQTATLQDLPLIKSLSTGATIYRTITIPGEPAVEFETGNMNEWPSDDKVAKAAIEALADAGWEVVVTPGLRVTSTFTPEELTVISGPFTVEKKES